MKQMRLAFPILGVVLMLPSLSWATKSLVVPRGALPYRQAIDDAMFRGGSDGWTVLVDLSGETLKSGETLLSLAGDDEKTWLSAAVTQERTLVAFSLKTDYQEAPLSVAVPVTMLETQRVRTMLLRYRGNSLDLFLDGVLVDQEWPLGEIVTGKRPLLTLGTSHPSVTVWDVPLTDKRIEADNGGASKIAARADTILGPQPEFVQYSRPRGWNTNAGDAMPYFHDGVFHLYYLLDRRQHRSKWGLGAHQWAHISSPDLVHWTHYPTALSIDHDWEGSICTGSVFFNGGKYYAFYATRMRDRSEHLAVAIGNDTVHFKKIIPTPFAEPQAPYVHGPNRDPFVFQADGKFHMLVTAALPAEGGKTEGALEYLTSNDLEHWVVEDKPFLRVGTTEQPECSDLFAWKDWYYLVYSLSGVTHYKMAKSPLGPWTKPDNDILDGPEAIVMKAAAFRDNRFLTVGFVQHDNRYGGDLVFRELVQDQDGSLGSKFPQEMMHPLSGSVQRIDDLNVSTEGKAAKAIDVRGDMQLDATVHLQSAAAFDLAMITGKEANERITFDSAARTIGWVGPDGKAEHAILHNVSDLSRPVSITLVIHETIADLSVNGHRTLVHRLLQKPDELTFETKSGAITVEKITQASIR